MELGFNRIPWYGEIATFLLIAVAGYLVFHSYWVVTLGDEARLDREELAEPRLEIDQAVRASAELRAVEVEIAKRNARRESLLGRTSSSAAVNARPPGVAGLSVNQLSLQGLVFAEGVTFLQVVNDPLSLVKEREVLRTLQGREDGR